MHRLLRQLDRLDADHFPRRRERGDVARKVTACIVAIALATTIAVVFARRHLGITVSMDGLRRELPLGDAPEVAGGIGSLKFSMTQPTDPSQPVTYDPCRPIEYEVNAALAPNAGDRLLTEAAAELEVATGLQFRYLGTSDRSPTWNRFGADFGRAPVIIGWTTPDAVPELEGRVAGLGGSRARRDDVTGDLEYVSGVVALDSPQLAKVLSRPNGDDQVRAIIMHELAHVVGLDHVNDPNELMYSENVGRVAFGPGDREGLSALGSGRCF